MEQNNDNDFLTIMAQRLRPLEGSRSSSGIQHSNIKMADGQLIEHRNAPIGNSPTGAYTAVKEDTTTGYGHFISEHKVGSNQWWNKVEKEEKRLKDLGVISQEADILELDEENADNLLKHDIQIRQKDLNTMLKDYKHYPQSLKVELSQSHYRGDIKPSHKFVTLMNQGKFKQAKKEFMNNSDYKKYKKMQNNGQNNNIVGRFEATEQSIQNLIDTRKKFKDVLVNSLKSNGTYKKHLKKGNFDSRVQKYFMKNLRNGKLNDFINRYENIGEE